MYQIEKCRVTEAVFSHQRQDFSGKMQDFSGEMQGNAICRDGSVVLSTDPKPRLRWTAELHERFVDAVSQLGGADSKFMIYHIIC